MKLAKIAFAALLALHCGEDPASEDSKPGRLGLHSKHEMDSTQLACPEGTREMGAAPPEGLEQYCAIVAEDGSEILHGPARTWHGSRRKESEGSFENGKRHGVWFFWHADTTAGSKGRFEHGKRHGRATYWYSPGKKKEEGQYRYGKRQGTWTEMQEGAARYRRGEYVDDRKHGPWREYGADGELLGTLTYDSGEVVGSLEEPTAPSGPVPR